MTEARLLLRKVSNGQTFALAGTMIVGRSDECQLRLVEGKPSRHHAQITVSGTLVSIEDLGSTNGTFVNDRRLEARVKVTLASGDRVRFDLDEFVFAAEAAPGKTDPDKTVYRVPDPKPAEATPRKVKLEEPRAGGSALPAGAERSAGAAPSTASAARASDRPSAGATAAAATSGAGPAAPEPAIAEKNAIPGAWETPAPNSTVLVDPKRRKSAAARALPPTTHAPGDPPYFWVESGEHAGRKISLATTDLSKKVWTIGSGDDRDICLREIGVSSKHALLRHDNRSWRLTDDVSVNGTFLNNQRIFKSFLSDGDRVRFGPIECVFRIPEALETQRGFGGGRLKKLGLIVAIAFALTLLVLFAIVEFLK